MSADGEDVDIRGYKALAWALISDALVDYHSYHNRNLRRFLVLQQIGNPRKLGKRERQSAKFELLKLRAKASLADRWFSSKFNARYPFWLAAGWLGWESSPLAARLRSNRTGWNLLVQKSTTSTNASEPDFTRVAAFLETRT